MTHQHSQYHAVAVIMLCALLGSCANFERPVAEMSRADSSIALAERNGAQEYGAQALDSAREKYAAAQSAASNEDFELAFRLANEANLDAQLAMAQTDRGKSAAALEELNASLSTLQRETTSGITD
jgi:hypothetical protein